MYVHSCTHTVCERAAYCLKARVCVDGSVAERSKALVLGTSHFNGVGSNPTTASNLFFFHSLSGCALVSRPMHIPILTSGTLK